MTLLERLEDLLEQATTERSHYYTASVLKDAIEFVKLHGANQSSTNVEITYVKEAIASIEVELITIKRALGL